MRIILTAPFIDTQGSPNTDLDIPITDIVSYVMLMAAKKGFVLIDPSAETPMVRVTDYKATECSRIFEVDFTRLYDDEGIIDPRIVKDFSDTSEMHVLSWYKTLGRLLIVRYGQSVIEELANRIFSAYYQDSLPIPADVNPEHTIVSFGQSYWPVVMVHHFLVELSYESGMLKKD